MYRTALVNSLTTPEFVRAILEWPMTWPIARFALVAMFLASALSKIVKFSGGVAEMVEAGMPAPVPIAALSILVELSGSVMVLVNRWAWLGAGMLGVFTAIGAVTTHAFWKMSGPAQKDAIQVFLMHVAVIAALTLDALLAQHIGR